MPEGITLGGEVVGMSGSADGSATRAGRPSLDLVATVHGRFGPQPRDDLGTAAGVRAWLAAVGQPGVTVTEEGAEHLRRLREAVFRLLGVATGDERPRTGDVDLLNRLTRPDVPAPRLRVQPGPGRAPRLVAQAPAPDFDQVLSALARDAVGLLTGPDGGSVRQCEGESCGTYYLDTSRGGRRRWCSSASCGNRSRVAAHRGRSRPGGAPG
jgi:predicted RNA-binding Zn ribbon-like protein